MSTGVAKHRFDISLEDLQTFIAVSNLKGIGRAARYLNLSQPSVSNRIRRLEEKLNVKLLERGERGVSLTENGEQLHHQAVEALLGLNDLLQRFHGEAADNRRELQLSVVIMMAQIKLPCILSDFRDAYPQVAVHVHEQTVSEATDALLEGRCELALMTCEDLPDALDHELLVVDESVIVTSTTHPLNQPGGATLAQALAYPLLLPREHYPQLAPVYQAIEARGLRMNLAPEAEGVRHPLTLMTLAAAGLGVLIFPRTLVPEELGQALASIHLADCVIPRRFGLVWAKARRLSPQANSFREFLNAARAPDHLTWPDGRRARLQ